MDILDKSFVPLYEEQAKYLWKAAKAQRGNPYMESWVCGLAYQCTGGGTSDFYNADETSAIQSITSLFFEFISSKIDAISKDPDYQEILNCISIDDGINSISKLLKRCETYFKNNCIEIWRNVPGSFAYIYRKTQNGLRKCLNKDWELYDASWFYGPSQLQDSDLSIDIKDETVLRSIPLTTPEPLEKDIFKAEILCALAVHFHCEVCTLNSESDEKNNRVKVAVRNLSRWLCGYYLLLDANLMRDYLDNRLEEHENDNTNNDFRSGRVTLELNVETENRIVEYAKIAASRLTVQQKKIYSMRLDDFSLGEMCKELGLSRYKLDQEIEQLRSYLGAEMLKYPELCCAVEEDAYEELPVDTYRGELFMSALGRYCKGEAR